MPRRGHQVGRRKPSRTVIPYAHRNGYRMEVPVHRCGGQVVECESLLEGDFVTLVEAYDRDLVEIQEQPFPLKVWLQGRFAKWTPDFLLRHEGRRPELVEVKTLEALYPGSEAGTAKVSAWVEAVAGKAHREGFDFSLQTEDEIRVQPLLGNAKLLCRHADDLYPSQLVQRGREALLPLPAETSVPALQTVLGGETDGFALAIRLDWLGHAEIDRTRAFSRVSRMRRL